MKNLLFILATISSCYLPKTIVESSKPLERNFKVGNFSTKDSIAIDSLCKDIKLSPKIFWAQHDLESNFGRSNVAKKCNNFSGIRVRTKKGYIYRKFSNPMEWAICHISIMRRLYQPKNDFSEKAWITSIQNLDKAKKYRYAEDEKYASKILSLLNKSA